MRALRHGGRLCRLSGTWAQLSNRSLFTAQESETLVNPFSLRPLICSYLLQHPKKSRGIFPSLLPIDSALRKSALLSKHYWSPCSLLHQCIKGLDELKFHFRQLVPFIFFLFSTEKQDSERRSAWVNSRKKAEGKGQQRWTVLLLAEGLYCKGPLKLAKIRDNRIHFLRF